MDIDDFIHKFGAGVEHDKDKLCLYCFNRRLRRETWTHKPGERSVKVGRYVGAGRGGR